MASLPLTVPYPGRRGPDVLIYVMPGVLPARLARPLFSQQAGGAGSDPPRAGNQ